MIFNPLRKHIVFISSLVVLFANNAFAQAPGIEWQNTIGGTLDDIGKFGIPTSDGGCIVGGYSYSSISGDKGEINHGPSYSYDFWIIKLNTAGLIEWENTIGGSSYDFLTTINETSDGGYIVGGYSQSNVSGDKTEIANSGSNDYWVIKLNSSGNIEWQNTIGGSGDDKLFTAQQTPDGGYIIGGYSISGATVDKTEGNYGSFDFWVIKLNSIGSIVWQNTLGGNASDVLHSLCQTSDGGFILAGNSSSGISGDKTELNFGLSDYWLVKLNSSGIFEWDKTYGGDDYDVLNSVFQTLDGGYILGGYSQSGISGNKTETNWIGGGLAIYDYWVIKTDQSGNIQWQNDIGSTSDDILQTAIPTFDGGYLLGGSSNGSVTGDKTESAFGGYYSDQWIVKLDNGGEIMWQNSIGGSVSDYVNSIHQFPDGKYLLVGSSVSPISGDKTEPNAGYDYWVITLASDCIPSPELCNSLDDNCNGLIDDAITETISISAGGPTTFCQGGNVLLTASYSGATVQWKKNGTNIPGATSPTFLVTTKGTYSCETISACDTALSSGIFVNVQKNPPAAITAGGPTTFCAGGSVILTANAGAGLSYQWYKGASLITGATSINYTATTSGNYKCRVTKTATGCFKNSNAINVSVPCKEGLSDGEAGELLLNENLITIAPNPNNGTFMLNVLFGAENKLNAETATIEIYNPLGQIIFTQQLLVLDNSIHENISTNNLAAGMYQVKISYAENSFMQQLFIQN